MLPSTKLIAAIFLLDVVGGGGSEVVVPTSQQQSSDNSISSDDKMSTTAATTTVRRRTTTTPSSRLSSSPTTKKNYVFRYSPLTLSDCADDMLLNMMDYKAASKYHERLLCLNTVLRHKGIAPYPDDFVYVMDPDLYLLPSWIRPYWPREYYDCHKHRDVMRMPFTHLKVEEKRFQGEQFTDGERRYYKCAVAYILTMDHPPEVRREYFEYDTSKTHPGSGSPHLPPNAAAWAVVLLAVSIFICLFCCLSASTKRNVREEARRRQEIQDMLQNSSIRAANAPQHTVDQIQSLQYNNLGWVSTHQQLSSEQLPSYSDACGSSSNNNDSCKPAAAATASVNLPEPPAYEEAVKNKDDAIV